MQQALRYCRVSAGRSRRLPPWSCRGVQRMAQALYLDLITVLQPPQLAHGRVEYQTSCLWGLSHVHEAPAESSLDSHASQHHD